MQSMPSSTIFAAGSVVILAAVVGLYMGVSRSLTGASAATDDAGTVVPAVTPVASAKPILIPTPTLDEAEVRRLAREEAQALIAKAAPARKPASSDDDDDAAGDQLTPVTPTLLAPAKPPAPAPPT